RISGSDRIKGRVTVNVEPLPNSLSTVSSPPINWQNLRDSARPSPVPPYFFDVLASACVKAWKSFDSCSGVMPMPVSRTVKPIVERESVGALERVEDGTGVSEYRCVGDSDF